MQYFFQFQSFVDLNWEWVYNLLQIASDKYSFIRNAMLEIVNIHSNAFPCTIEVRTIAPGLNILQRRVETPTTRYVLYAKREGTPHGVGECQRHPTSNWLIHFIFIPFVSAVVGDGMRDVIRCIMLRVTGGCQWCMRSINSIFRLETGSDIFV